VAEEILLREFGVSHVAGKTPGIDLLKQPRAVHVLDEDVKFVRERVEGFEFLDHPLVFPSEFTIGRKDEMYSSRSSAGDHLLLAILRPLLPPGYPSRVWVDLYLGGSSRRASNLLCDILSSTNPVRRPSSTSASSHT